ncbi:MAG: 50S ribosomal protein L11 [Nanoarchaeota archaeon]
MKVKLIVEGGNMQPGPAVAQQLGPMGINIGKVISDVNKETAGFKGTKVPVEIDVNGKTKTYTISVFSPPVSELIKKELSLEKGSGVPNNFKVGNISFESIVSIAKTKMPNLLARDMKSAVKLIVGTCTSMGVYVDSKEPKEIELDIDAGVYNAQISQEITVTSEEKKKQLAVFFAAVKSKQEQAAKAAEEAKAAAEAAKAEAAPPAAEAAKTEAAPAKKEEKPEAKPKGKK